MCLARGGLIISTPERVPATQLLYYEDPYLKEFDAKVLKIIKLDDYHGLILNRTAFYPTGGGQPPDAGVVQGKRGEIQVTDVQMTDATVIHVADKAVEEVWKGETVKGIIDWDRRDALMRNHTTAHLMAEALRRVIGHPVEIVGSAIDIDKARLDLAYEGGSLLPLFPEIEKAANAIVKENRTVEAKMMPRKEAEKYVRKFHESLKTLPPKVENVRIIEIKDLHACACGGTHVKNTGEIGTVKLLKRGSKGRGVERIEFVAKKS